MPSYEEILIELNKRKLDLSTWTVEELEKGLQKEYEKKIKKEKIEREKDIEKEKGAVKK